MRIAGGAAALLIAVAPAWSKPLQGPQEKLHPLLREGAAPSWCVTGEGADGAVVTVLVALRRDVLLQEAFAASLRNGAAVVTQLSAVNALVVEVPASRLAALAAEDAVQWIEPPLPRLTEVNDGVRAATQADLVSLPPDALDGSGVVVMLFDGGAAAGHADFEGRLTVRDGDAPTNHATHVAGTIGGSGAGSGGQYRGMAPAVAIESFGLDFGPGPVFLYTNPGDLEADYWQAVNQLGAVLANNSLGSNVESNGFACALQGDYGVTSAVIDAIVCGALGRTIISVWAAGNERQGSRCDVEGFGDYYSMAPPACAKNHLTVGAVNSNDASNTTFTSFGPCDDGRLKPDVCAPGCQSGGDGGVTSTSASGGYAVMCGTSMAAPSATGLAALLVQAHRGAFPGMPDLRPATIKALLVHGAEDLGNPGPDYQTGYGLIQIRDSIDRMRAPGFMESGLGHGESRAFLVSVPPGSTRFQATLAWDDPPALPASLTALVNDLDLIAFGPDGAHFPWVLDPANPMAPAAQSGPDRLNNLEQVRVANPVPGLWAVEVHGFDVPHGPQDFSIIVEPQLVATTISLPDGPVALVPPGIATSFAVRVTSAGEEIVKGSVQLHVRVNGGPFVAFGQLDLGNGLHQATLPGVACGDVIDYYLSASGSISGPVLNPLSAPAVTHGASVGAWTDDFADDFEIGNGWAIVNGAGLASGAWERGVPVACQRGDPPADADGSGACFLTGNSAAVDCDSDIDGGMTTLTSPLMDASAAGALISYSRWYSNSLGNAPLSDVLIVEVSGDGGSTWTAIETVGPGGPETGGGWVHREFPVAGSLATDQFRIRFSASDLGAGSIVEAAVDDVRVRYPDCAPSPCPWDLDGDAAVGIADFLGLLKQWGTSPPGPPDFDGEGTVNVGDFLTLLSRWGPCP